MTKQGWLQPLVLATILAAGFAVVWGGIGMWALEIGLSVVQTGPEYKSLVFLADGTPRVMEHNSLDGGPFYFDLDGNEVPAPENVATSCSLPAVLPVQSDVSWERRLRCFSDGRVPTDFWYFVCDGRRDGTAYFVGYDSHTKACVGYLGTAGFREAPPPAEEQFPFSGGESLPGARVLGTLRNQPRIAYAPGQNVAGRAPEGSISAWDVYVLGRGGKVYHADLQQRTVHVALDEPRLRSASLMFDFPDPVHGTPTRLAARTDEAILVLDVRGELLRRYPIPAALRDRPFSFGEATMGEAILTLSTPLDELATEVTYEICWLSPDGRCRTASTTLPYSGGLRGWAAVAGIALPSPAVLLGFIEMQRSEELLQEGLCATYLEALSRASAEFWPALTIAQVAAVGLAGLCYYRQVRYGERGLERWLWPLFVLVLGLPGWIGYRFGRSWPVLEACPRCGASARRDREACVHCETDFPRQALRGTEVFA
jgi:hypothetical protein